MTIPNIKSFLPLIIIISTIILLTMGLQLYQRGSWYDGLSNFMGIFFIVFGGFKIINLYAFAEAYQEYDLIAKNIAYYAYAYPFIELSLGIAYLMRWHLLAVNGITLIIMFISAIGVAKELLQGREIICACLGAVFKIPMTWVTFAEDMLMALMALAMIIVQLL